MQQVSDAAWDLFECGESEATLHITPPESQALPSLDDTLLAVSVSFADDVLALLQKQVPAVCRRFRGIFLLQPACWQRLVLAAPVVSSAVVTDDVVCRIARVHGHQLLHIHLDGARRVGAAAVLTLAHTCYMLRSATMVGCVRVGSAAIRFLSRSCPKLEVLRVAGCAAADEDQRHREDVPVSAANRLATSAADSAVHSMAGSCPLLHSVSLSSVRSDRSIVELLTSCRELTALDLAACPELPCAAPMLTALSEAQQRLQSLKLGDCSRLSCLHSLHNCNRLRTLFLGGCSRLGDNSGLGGLLTGCASTLEFASFVGCQGITAIGLADMFLTAQCLPELKTLVLGGCRADDSMCRVVADVCPSLTSLDLWNCNSISNAGVRNLLHRCAALAELNLRECSSVDGAAIAVLGSADSMCNLHTLDVAFIGNLDNEALLPLLSRDPGLFLCLNCGGPRCFITDLILERLPASLTGLDLAECAMIQDFSPLMRLRCLSSLSLDSCSISLHQLLQICETCPLTSLNVASSCVDDFSLAALAEMRPRLLDIELRNCAISDLGLEGLVNCCRHLVYIGLNGTRVTQNGISLAKESLPACDVASDFPST